jgi:glucose/arabinose dehydrogenase
MSHRPTDSAADRFSAAAWFAILAAVAATLFFLAHRFARSEMAHDEDRRARPRVTNTRPAAFEAGVAPITSIAADVRLPNLGQGVDASSLSGESVQLIRMDTLEPVAAHVNTTGSGDAIVLVPRVPLAPGTRYQFVVTDRVTDTAGHRFFPFRSEFTTAEGQTTEAFPAAFDRVNTIATIERSAFTAITIGPDRRLYAGTYDGRIFVFPIEPDGTLAKPTISPVLLAHAGGPRLITGLRFDPASTPQDPVLWVSHGQMKLQDADDWTGTISRLRGASLEQVEDVVVQLPRAYKDHLNFQLEFGSDGAIYFNQGSMTGCGAPDLKWGMRSESALTAAILRLDPSRLTTLPLVARTDGPDAYDPYAPGAPLTVFATGVRSGFDLLQHGNGRLYCAINGAAAGGNAPASPPDAPGTPVPALNDIQTTTDDVLIDIREGLYYGHPNPARGEYVLNGGNPTAGRDVQEVVEYPVGTAPDLRYRAPAFSFGKNFSPNGMIEYRSDAFGPTLKGAIFVARWSAGDDLVVLRPRPDGSIAESIVGIDGLTGFTDPLDLALDERSGNVYVAEYGGGRITLLRPAPGRTSPQVFVGRNEPVGGR